VSFRVFWRKKTVFKKIAFKLLCTCKLCENATLRNKKVLRETQTLHAGCNKVEPKFFACPTADPYPGGAGRPKFNQLEIVTTFTYKPSLVKIDARNFELLW